MPDFLHEIVKKRETQQEYYGWQQSIEHAIGQQDINDPWGPVIVPDSAEQNVHYSGGPF
jgi:hypothetical protein